MTRQDLITLCNYDRWATHRILEAVASLNPEQYSKDLGSSFGGIRGTLVHIYAADWIWLERWKGESPTELPKADERLPTVPVLRQRWDALRSERDDFMRSLTDEKLNAPLSYRDTKGNSYCQPLRQLIQHVISWPFCRAVS